MKVCARLQELLRVVIGQWWTPGIKEMATQNHKFMCFYQLAVYSLTYQTMQVQPLLCIYNGGKEFNMSILFMQICSS